MSDHPIETAIRWRAMSVTSLLGLLLVGLVYKAYQLQIRTGPKLRSLASKQHVKTVEVAAPRGAIVDAKDRPLAVTANAESVWANPKAVKDVASTAARLAELLSEDVRVMEARLASPRHFAWISRHVTTEQADAVRAAKLTGVELAEEPKRWYPGRSSGATVLGSANLDGNGVDGVELWMDKWLLGERAKAIALRDARGRRLQADGLLEARPGATIRLTIDQAVQSIADEALMEAVAKHEARAGVVVVLDVGTGAVLALANMPTMDPNIERKVGEARNRAITDAYEIGSSMKVFTVATALQAGAVSPNDVFDVENGKWTIAGKTVRDVHDDPVLSVGGILKRSSNVGAVKVALRLGKTGFYDGLRTFGFGQKTGIDLPGEASGTVRPVANWQDVDFVTMAYGYGLSVTPIQMAAALAAIGNRGVYNTPYIVQDVVQVDAAEATAWQPKRAAPRRVLRADLADAMLPMLASVFDKAKEGVPGGTAASVTVPGYMCGGKTGTAHKYDPEIHRYAEKKYYSSFIGLAPIAKPKLAIVVIIDEPSNGDYFGGKAAGPVFAKLASESLRALGVPNDAPWDVAPLAKPRSVATATDASAASVTKATVVAPQ